MCFSCFFIGVPFLFYFFCVSLFCFIFRICSFFSIGFPWFLFSSFLVFFFVIPLALLDNFFAGFLEVNFAFAVAAIIGVVVFFVVFCSRCCCQCCC